jgi:DNA-binding response OmpR family regulator
VDAKTDNKTQGSGRSLLIVDDDDLLRRSLKDQIAAQNEFAAIDEAADAVTALKAAKAKVYDVILLDIGLPDADGRDVCRQLRAAGVRSPIIMLTAADSDDDTITGLEAGANDYVTKPFRMAVLLARLRAHLRQHEKSDDAIFIIGPYKFQPAAKMLLVGDGQKKIRLTEKETAILKYLYRIGNKMVSRETLLGEVWGYNAGVTTHTLETHVYRLRQKIEPDPDRVQLLITEPGGYRLNP